MPGRNIIKVFTADSYYHVYNRGVAKLPVFLDDQDYRVFLGLFGRYLSNKPTLSNSRMKYPWYQSRLDVLAYCLMPNHIHLLIYQCDEKALTEFMRSLMTSYGMYFNKRYRRVGPVFQSHYKANRISDDSYLEHISRYIHLNPRDWEDYSYSSLKYYLNQASAEWIKPDTILGLFPDQEQYLQFIRDYEGHKQMLDEIRWDLADYE